MHHDRNHSNWTGRASRSLDDAFGPHCSRHFEEPMDFADKLVTGASTVALIALIAIIVFVG